MEKEIKKETDIKVAILRKLREHVFNKIWFETIGLSTKVNPNATDLKMFAHFLLNSKDVCASGWWSRIRNEGSPQLASVTKYAIEGFSDIPDSHIQQSIKDFSIMDCR